MSFSSDTKFCTSGFQWKYFLQLKKATKRINVPFIVMQTEQIALGILNCFKILLNLAQVISSNETHEMLE